MTATTAYIDLTSHFFSDVTNLQPTTESPLITTANQSNETEGGSQLPEYFREEQIGFLVVLCLLIVVGNSIVLAAIALSRERRRSRMNFFIMNLAIADLSNGPLNVLIDLIQKITFHWYAGDVMCRILQYTRAVVIYASTYMLVSLSIDRLDAVARPMHFSGSWTRAKVLIASAWVISFLFAVPELFLFGEKYMWGSPQCYIDLQHDWHWQLYISVIALILFIIPAIIICTCYVIIIAIIWRSSLLLKPSENEHKRSSRRSKVRDEELLNGNSAGSRSDSCTSSRGIIPQAKIRTIKMTFIIVLVFILCWSPYFVFNLCQVYGHVPETKTMNKLATFFQSLAPLNSAANPVIYGIFSTRICRYLSGISGVDFTASQRLSTRVHVPKTVRPSVQLLFRGVSTGNVSHGVYQHVRN